MSTSAGAGAGADLVSSQQSPVMVVTNLQVVVTRDTDSSCHEYLVTKQRSTVMRTQWRVSADLLSSAVSTVRQHANIFTFTHSLSITNYYFTFQFIKGVTNQK